MISFLTLFLSLITGPQTVELAVDPRVAEVALFLDGEKVGERSEPPWTFDCDFGPLLAPRRLEAVARGEGGEVLDRVSQLLNVPRDRAELVLTVAGAPGQERATITWEAVEHRDPVEIRLEIDGQPVPVQDPASVPLPDLDGWHWLRAEGIFENGFRAEAFLSYLAGQGAVPAMDSADAQVTAVPLQRATRGGLPSPESLAGGLVVGGRPLDVLAVESSGGDVVVVPDYRLAGIFWSQEKHRRAIELAPEEGTVRWIEPVAPRAAPTARPTDLFQRFPVPGSGSLDRLFAGIADRRRHSAHPLTASPRLADAVALAGWDAAAGRGRRAVLLILGREVRTTLRRAPQDESRATIAEARAYLEQLGVPLVVWTPYSDLARASPWGPAEDISRPSKLFTAARRLRKLLEGQATAWVRGSLLPREIRLAQGASPRLDLIGIGAGERVEIVSLPASDPVSVAEREAEQRLWEVESLEARGRQAWTDGDLTTAEELFTSALEATRERLPGHLEVAELSAFLGAIAWQKGRPEDAEVRFREALELYRELAPEALEMADIEINLAGLSLERGDLGTSRTLYRRALERLETHTGVAERRVEVLYTLGVLAARGRRPADALGRWQEALGVVREIGPDAQPEADLLYVMGQLQGELGLDQAGADTLEQARQIYQRLEPGSARTEQLAALVTERNQARDRWTGEREQARRRVESLLLEEASMRREAEGLRRESRRKKLSVRADRARQEALLEVAGWANQGTIASRLGDRERAREYFADSTDIYRRWAPDSPLLAGSLLSLGQLARLRGDGGSAEGLLTEALEIFRRLDPEGSGVATCLAALGHVAFDRGDLDGAERRYREAAAIPGGQTPAARSTRLLSFGTVARSRGELDRAERFFHQALGLDRSLRPEGPGIGDSLVQLGLIADERGRPERAAEYFTQALASFRESLPVDAPEIALAQALLGAAHRKKGDLAAAERHLEEALQLFEVLAPESLEMADALILRGRVARDRGDLAAAERWLSRGLVLQQTLGADEVRVAAALFDLGTLARDRGDLEAAEGFFADSLARRRRLLPGGTAVAEGLMGLASVARSAGKWGRARGLLEEACELYGRQGSENLNAVTCRLHLGLAMSDSGDLDLADRYLHQALEAATSLAPGGLLEVHSLLALGAVAIDREELDLAADLLHRALALERSRVDDSPTLATISGQLGEASLAGGRFATARDHFEDALAVLSRVAPESLMVASIQARLGALAIGQGHPGEARERLLEALRIQHQRGHPESPREAEIYRDLGRALRDLGNLVEAEQRFEQALEIFHQRQPDGLEVAEVLDWMSKIARDRGDLDLAVDRLEASLALERRQPAGTGVTSDNLRIVNRQLRLAPLLAERGDHELAEAFLLQVVDLLESQAPADRRRAEAWLSLGEAREERGQWMEAGEAYRKALELADEFPEKGHGGTVEQPIHPSVDSDLEARARFALGRISLETGDPHLAEPFLRQALEHEREMSGDGARTARILHWLGEAARQRGDRDEAERLFSRALETLTSFAPGSLEVATTAAALGAIRAESGKHREASEDFQHAMDALEAQAAKLGGSRRTRAGFGARHLRIYRQAIDNWLALEEAEEAFAVLERSRARGFLELLSQRDLLLDHERAGPLELERRRLGVLYDRALERWLNGSDPARPADREDLEAELRDLQRRREEVIEKIRRTSPRLANLRFPKPLGARQAAEALDPGTWLLSFSVGESSGLLFLLAPGEPLRVFRLDVGEKELRREVELFRRRIFSSDKASFRDRFQSVGIRLYETLLKEAEPHLQGAERLLILPDGPLHLLPWNALVRPEGERGWSYLVEWKPTSVALSATVLDTLRQRRGQSYPESSGPRFLAFGDPSWSDERLGSGAPPPEGGQGRARDLRWRVATDRGLRLEPLPSTRTEVEAIARLFPEVSLVFLGAEATEEKVFDGPSAPFLHFATHGFIDERSPLDSGLALASPVAGQDNGRNGLMQAWEIFEGLRLPGVEMVVLSGCETGLGEEVRGEGLLGLTRAFQHAGARSVLASLWRVADHTTPLLMVRFYRHVLAGLSKDRALQAAQLELLTEPVVVEDGGERRLVDATAPYHWAAFQLFGDAF